MRESVREAIGETIQDLILSGAKTSFSEKELKKLGINYPEVEIHDMDKQKIRGTTK